MWRSLLMKISARTNGSVSERGAARSAKDAHAYPRLRAKSISWIPIFQPVWRNSPLFIIWILLDSPNELSSLVTGSSTAKVEPAFTQTLGKAFEGGRLPMKVNLGNQPIPGP